MTQTTPAAGEGYLILVPNPQCMRFSRPGTGDIVHRAWIGMPSTANAEAGRFVCRSAPSERVLWVWRSMPWVEHGNRRAPGVRAIAGFTAHLQV